MTHNAINGGFIRARSCVTTPARQEFLTTVGQTVFNIGMPAIGGAAVFRNGVRLPIGSVAVSGTTVTYAPASNGGQAMLANDRVTIDYSWLDCSGVATGVTSICEVISGMNDGGSVG